MKQRNIKLSENNRLIQEIVKNETKKYTAEVKQNASKYISKLQKDILKQCNYDIFDKEYEVKGNEEKAVYKWFGDNFNNLINNMNIGIHQILNKFNINSIDIENNMNVLIYNLNKSLSLENSVDSNAEVVKFTISDTSQNTIKDYAYSLIDEMFSYNVRMFEDYYKIGYVYYIMYRSYIEFKMAMITGSIGEKDVEEIVMELEELKKHTLIQVDSLKAVLHEYEIMGLGQQFADIIYYNSINFDRNLPLV